MKSILNSTDKLTSLITDLGINTWIQLCNHIKSLPYSRNKNRTDFELVIKEGKGTCSSKHALLKEVANLNNIPDIELILGIYKMNTKNTSKIGNVLNEYTLDFIPEAHCYLKINGVRTDFTSENSTISLIEKDILEEINITPEQVIDYKVKYHKEYLTNWIKENNINYSFEELWSIREECIKNLSL